MLIYLAALFYCLAVRQASAECRAGQGVDLQYCGLPDRLANFQGYHACDPKVLIGTPKTIGDLQRVVQSFPRIRAVGVGHSCCEPRNEGQFCAGNDSSSVGIVMTEVLGVKDIYTNGRDAADPANAKFFQSFPIKVIEDDPSGPSVWVSAGVSQRILLDYLANYASPMSSDGYEYPAFSWYIDQTIGGAVATATHGSSLRYGSISSQVLTLEVMLPDGSVRNITRSDPHLFRAWQVSVGRLGIILRLQLRLVPQTAIRRNLQDLNFGQFLGQLRSFQASYRAALATGDSAAISRALTLLDETQVLWFVPTSTVWRVDYQHLEKEPPGSLLNIVPQPVVTAFSGPDASVGMQVGTRPTPPNGMIGANPTFWSNFIGTGLRSRVAPGTFERRQAYLTMSEPQSGASSSFIPYDQYEVAVPIESAADCLAEVGGLLYGSERLSDGFRSPGLIRFVTGEEGYLAPAQGGPRMFVNIEDYLGLSSGKPNVPFQRIIAQLLNSPSCRGRLHWGKSGWDAGTGNHNTCFSGAKVYPKWCDFGCAALTLDPSGKFRGSSRVWQWAAGSSAAAGATVTGGDYVSQCCSESGFRSDVCTCQAVDICS